MKNFIIIILIVAAVIGGGALLKKDAPATTSKQSSNYAGKGTSGVTVDLYGDFQCPGCGSFYPIVKQVTEHYKDEIKFRFVHFPLTQIHLNALGASRAAQAASNQGKFWDMHDLLYANQSVWSQSTDANTTFEAFANQLKLDMTKYRKDFASAETNAIINADVAAGQKLKVTGTPTFYIDGKIIDDNNTIATAEKFQEKIDAEILAKTGKPSTSIKSTTTTDTTAPDTTGATVPAGSGDSAGASE